MASDRVSRRCLRQPCINFGDRFGWDADGYSRIVARCGTPTRWSSVLTKLDTRRGNEQRAFLTEARFAELHGDSIENHEGLKKVTRRAASIDGKTIEDIKVEGADRPSHRRPRLALA
jgi:hypothetical protein